MPTLIKSRRRTLAGHDCCRPSGIDVGTEAQPAALGGDRDAPRDRSALPLIYGRWGYMTIRCGREPVAITRFAADHTYWSPGEAG
jgi:hypothetical protein